MTIDCAFFGFLAADADARTSKAGKPWTRLRVGVGRDDDVQWVNVAVFGKAAEAAAMLKKGDRVYCEGVIKLDIWRGDDGIKRHSLAAPHSSASEPTTSALIDHAKIGQARKGQTATTCIPTRYPSEWRA